MGSSEEGQNQEQSDHHLRPVPGDRVDPAPLPSPMTPEGAIDGVGTFAQGLKRLIRRWRRK